jgi:hypothetical protein
MKTNVGNLDRILRIVAAAMIGYLYFTGTITGTVAIIFLVLGGVFILTGAIGFCPLYLPFGINTKTKEEKK